MTSLIYIGKAVPAGWKRSRTVESSNTTSAKLYRRLIEHSNSIAAVSNLLVKDFYCRLSVSKKDQT